jgi:hypothetical protein
MFSKLLRADRNWCDPPEIKLRRKATKIAIVTHSAPCGPAQIFQWLLQNSGVKSIRIVGMMTA